MSEYDALLDPPASSEYDALLSPPSEYDALLGNPQEVAAKSAPAPATETPSLATLDRQQQEQAKKNLADYTMTREEVKAQHPDWTDAQLTAFRADATKRYKELAPMPVSQTPLISIPKPQSDTVLSGVIRGAESVVENLSTPENLMLMAPLAKAPAVVQKLAALGFGAQMASGIPAQTAAVLAAETPSAKAEKATELLGSAALAGLAFGHGTDVRDIARAENARAIPGGPINLTPLTDAAIKTTKGGEPNAIQVESPAGEMLRNAPQGTGGNVGLQAVEQGNQPEVAAQTGVAPQEVTPTETKGGEIPNEVQKEGRQTLQVTETGPRIVGTAIQVGGETLRGPSAFSSHQEILAENPQLFDLPEAPDLNKQGGFIARNPDGTEQFVSRAEATDIAKAAGQVPKTKTGELHSQEIGQSVNIEQTVRDAVAQHGDLAGAGEALQKQLDDPNISAEDKARVEGALKKIGSLAEDQARAEMQAEADAARSNQNELLDTVQSLGGLPRIDSPEGKAASGELQRIVETFPEGRQGSRERNKLLREGAKPLDQLRQDLEQHGFHFETPYDMLAAIEESRRTGRPHYGERTDLPFGPGKMTAGELPPQRTTGLKRTVVDIERLARGAEPIPTVERQHEETVVREAEDKVDADPTAAPALVERINSGNQGRAITEQEAAMLLVERQRLHNVKEQAESVAGDPETPPEERATARAQWQDAESQLNELDQAQRTAGSTWGRLGHMYQRLIQEDFTLAAMERRARAAKGGEPLTEAESAKLAAQAKEIASLQEKIAAEQAARTAAQEQAALKDVYERQLKETQAELEKRPQFGKEVFDIAQGIVNRWKSEADVARQNLRQRLGKTSAGLDPTILVDVAKIVRAKVGEFGLDFARTKAAMLAEFGNDIAPYLQKAWVKAQQMIGKEKAPAKAKQAIKTGAKKPKQPTADLKDRVKAEAAAGLELSHKLVYEIGKQKIEAGVRGEAAVAKAIHDDIKEFYPDATERDVRRAYVDYGKEVSPPNPEEVATHQRLIRQLFKVQEDIDRLNEGLGTWKSQKRDKAVLELREKMAQRSELLKKVKAPPTADELASRDQARQTQVRNAIEALDKKLRTGEEELKRAPAEPSPQLEQLKSELEAMRTLQRELKAEQAAALKTPETEAQKALNEAAVARERINQRLNDISEGKIDSTKPESKPALTQLEEDMRLETEALRQMANEMAREIRASRKPKTDPEVKREAAQLQALQKAIAGYDAQLASGKLETATRRAGPDTARVAALKDIRDSRVAALKAARRTGKPIESATERYNRMRIKAVGKQLKVAQERIAKGDFTKPPKRTPPAKEANTLALEAKLAGVKLEIRRGEERMRLANRTRVERTLDGISKWRRTFVLTGLHSLAKLTSAAGEIVGFAPIEEAIGGMVSKALPALAERAPRQGGFSWRTEARAVAETWRNLLKDAGDNWKTGNSELDLLYGKPNIAPPELKDYIGRLHGALKSPAKRNEFTRSFEKRMAYEASHGADPLDPLVQTKVAADAYKDAQRSIFLEDNMVVDAYRRALSRFSKPKEPSLKAKLAETAIKTTLPIVRIPTNIVARTFEYALGTGLGTARLGRAAIRGILAEKDSTGHWNLRQGFRKAIDDLKPDEAEAILRNLKRGSLGAAFLTLGFMNPDAAGGYYVEGQKKKKGDVEYGGLKVFGINIPRYLVHNPILEQLQIGATIRRVMDSKVRKTDKETRGLGAGAWAAMMGLLDETPFISEMAAGTKLAHPEGGQEFTGGLAQSVIPQLVQERAKEGIPFIYPADRDAQGNPIKRKPRTVWERFKMGLPVLRKTVPEKR